MKNIILGLQDNRQVLVFALVGLVLVLFPEAIGTIAPYLIGILLILYGILNIIISLKYPDSNVSLGGGIINIVLGAVILIQQEHSILIMGVVWAMISMHGAAKEIDEFRSAPNKVHLGTIVSLVCAVASVVLAILLMTDPFEHFNAHIQILGLEMIASSLVKGCKELKKKKQTSV